MSKRATCRKEPSKVRLKTKILSETTAIPLTLSEEFKIFRKLKRRMMITINNVLIQCLRRLREKMMKSKNK